jgi:hypothetical protein
VVLEVEEVTAVLGWGESSKGSTTTARELSQVAAAAASPFLRLSEHGEEKRKEM